MKFTTSVIALGLTAQALASPSLVERRSTKVQRNAAPFESVISAVDSAVKQFDTQVKSYNGGDVSTLLSDSKNIITVTDGGVSSLQSQGQLTDSDALALTTPVQGLSADVKQSIDDLVAKKSQLVAAGAGGTVESGLQAQLVAANSLATLISNKVPSSLSAVAGDLSSGISSAIQSGIDAFKGTGSTATTAPASSATKPAGTTAAAGTTTAAMSSATGAMSSAMSSAMTSATATATAGSATSSGMVPGGSSPSTGTVPAYTGAASATKATGYAGLLGVFLAVFAL